jgi:phage recombination protein Bet
MNDLVLFSKEWEAKTRELFLPGMPDAEVAVFMEICKLRNLNPFTKQVHFLPFWDEKSRKEKFAMVISIDGFRSLAARTGLYGGQDEPVFTYDKNGLLVSCKIAVYRKDFERPTVAVAHLAEYQRMTKDRQSGHMVPNSTWKKSPHIMISKCAEALALRKAFPDDLGGLYEESELGAIVDSELSKPEEPQTPVKSRAEAMAKKFAPKTIDASAMPSGIRLAKSLDEVSGTRGGSWVDAGRVDVWKDPKALIAEDRHYSSMLMSGPPPPTDDDAPRAEEDASNTATLESYAEKVKRSLGGKTESITPTDGAYVFDFGKFRGKRASELDDGTLKWMVSNLSNRPEALEAAREEIKARHKL